MDITVAQWSILISITIFASIAQSAIGFGFSLIAVPVFLIVLEVDIAVQLAMILTFSISVVMIFATWKDTPVVTFKRLALGSVIGFPLGFFFFYIATPELVKMVVGIAIIIALSLTRLNLFRSTHFKQSACNGIGAGIVSGAMVTSIAMAGPAIAIYANAIGFGKAKTRAIVFSVFLFSYGTAIVIHAVFYGFASSVSGFLMYLLPATLVGTIIGHWLAGRISETFFSRLLTFTLVAVAMYLIYSVSG